MERDEIEAKLMSKLQGALKEVTLPWLCEAGKEYDKGDICSPEELFLNVLAMFSSMIILTQVGNSDELQDSLERFSQKVNLATKQQIESGILERVNRLKTVRTKKEDK